MWRLVGGRHVTTYRESSSFGLLSISPAVMSSDAVRAHHVTRHNTPIQYILQTTPQSGISQKALGSLPEDGNVMPKHVEATIHN
jgi:hypothetical protein